MTPGARRSHRHSARSRVMRLLRLSFALAVCVTSSALAQGGRGRAPIQIMTLASPAFADGSAIPSRHAQPGEELSPALTWSGASDSAASFVLIVHDVNAPTGNGLDDVLHWLVWNIPGSARALAEGI